MLPLHVSIETSCCRVYALRLQIGYDVFVRLRTTVRNIIQSKFGMLSLAVKPVWLLTNCRLCVTIKNAQSVIYIGAPRGVCTHRALFPSVFFRKTYSDR